MYQREKPDSQTYFAKFLDKSRLNAERTGREQPHWPDVWRAAFDTPELADILTQRGIDVLRLRDEVTYIDRFTNLFQYKDELFDRSLFNEASRELRAGLERLREAYKSDPSRLVVMMEGAIEDMQKEMAADFARAAGIGDAIDTSRTMDALLDDLRATLDGSERSLSQSEHAVKLAAVKSELMREVVRHSGEKMMQRLHIGGVSPQRDAALEKTARKIADVTGELVEGLIQDLRFVGNYADNNDIIDRLKDLDEHPIQPPSPLEVMDMVIASSGRIYTQLMHRNGLRQTDAQARDELAELLPPRRLQRLMNAALDYAYRYNSVEVTPRHFMLALLHETDVALHLRKVGIKNLTDMWEKFREETISSDKKPDGHVSVHPDVAPLHQAFAGIEAAYRAKPHGAAMLRHMLASFPEMDKALNRAGLRRAMLAQWDKHYDADTFDDLDEDRTGEARGKKTEKGKKKDEKPKGFEVSDYEFEAAVREYAVDYTELARQRKFDPLIGYDDVLRQVETKLLKRGKKNPVVIGDPGIGKSQILKGLAQAVVAGKVHDDLVGARVISLDLQQMSDSPYIGVFEGRILRILKGVAERNALGKNPPIILEVDELDESLKSGGHSWSPGFQGLVKPFLTTGDILMVGAATKQGYQQKVATDPAFVRRAQPVYMDEPTPAQTSEILKGLKNKLTRHHKLRIPDGLLEYVATQADRFVFGVKNPDKSVDLLDEACAEARKKGDKTLRRQHIDLALSSKVKIPMDFLSGNERERIAGMEKPLRRRVMQQDHAVEAVSMAIKRAKAGFVEVSGRPIGNYIFVGPTGVGKTELAKALAGVVFGDEKFLVRYDMGAFGDKTSVSRFVGGSPNYVGYEQGGKLINDLNNQGFGVYLYDEIEKAHPEVFDALLAPFDDGIITDGRGVSASMRHVLNIMTTNLGSGEVRAEAAKRRVSLADAPDEWFEMAKPIYEQAVRAHFRPEFVNRIDEIVCFNPLSQRTIEKLVDRRVEKTAEQLKQNHGLELDLADVFYKAARERGFDPEMGARPLDRAWKKMMTGPMAEFLLSAGARDLAKAKRLVVKPAGETVAITAPQAPSGDGASVISLADRLAQGPRSNRIAYDLKTVRPVFSLS